MYHFDVYNDFLAMGGHTDGGNLLTWIPSFNYFPYLALQSISVGGMIYWAKTFSLFEEQLIMGLQFSTDGALLIAHGYAGISIS
jgi:hypothetical protein